MCCHLSDTDLTFFFFFSTFVPNLFAQTLHDCWGRKANGRFKLDQIPVGAKDLWTWRSTRRLSFPYVLYSLVHVISLET